MNTDNPIDVRDMLLMIEKRNAHMTDLFLQTQAMVQKFEDNIKTLDNRINNGLSPSINAVRAQNSEIEKTLIRFEGSITGLFKDVDKRITVENQVFSDQIERIEAQVEDYETLKKWARGLIGKIIVAGAGVVATTFVTMWIYVQQIKEKISDMPTTRIVEVRKR